MDLLIERDRGASAARTPAHARSRGPQGPAPLAWGAPVAHRNQPGRFICTLVDESCTATVTASNVPEAGAALTAALDDARETGYGECFWSEQGGDYRWMFRRQGVRVDVAVLWSTGVITGWAHVFRSEADFDWLDGRIRSELAKSEVRSLKSEV